TAARATNYDVKVQPIRCLDWTLAGCNHLRSPVGARNITPERAFCARAGVGSLLAAAVAGLACCGGKSSHGATATSVIPSTAGHIATAAPHTMVTHPSTTVASTALGQVVNYTDLDGHTYRIQACPVTVAHTRRDPPNLDEASAPIHITNT